ncbi:MAG: hypothetical protein HY290_03705 [Planctomycetia bacterium]|nr:hypothetical protein [Planctomycetia bacterium]
MTNVLCPKCQKETPHIYSGTATRGSDGWTIQPMRCAICTTEINQSEPPGIVYEFVGGPLDGKTISGADATGLYLQTSDGAVGQLFTPVESDPAVKYVVTQRRVLFGEILVRAQLAAAS